MLLEVPEEVKKPEASKPEPGKPTAAKKPETASTRDPKEPEPTAAAAKKVPSPQGISISQKRGIFLSLLKTCLLFILFCLSVHLCLSFSDYGITTFKTSVLLN